MNPIVSLGLLLGGGYAAKKAYDKYIRKGGSAPKPVDKLESGKLYAVTVAVTPETPGYPDASAMSANIKGAMDQTGFTVISMPAPRTQGDLSTWAFNAQWNLAQPYVTSPLPAWMGQSIVYPATTGG